MDLLIFVWFYFGTIIITLILYLIYLFRSRNMYEWYSSDVFGYMAWILFASVIPVLNIIVTGYYAVFLFERNTKIKRKYIRDIDALKYENYLMKKNIDKIY